MRNIDTFEHFVLLLDSSWYGFRTAAQALHGDKVEYPVVLFGPECVGKTTLLRDLERAFRLQKPCTTVRYTTEEELEKMLWPMEWDLLLIDDISADGAAAHLARERKQQKKRTVLVCNEQEAEKLQEAGYDGTFVPIERPSRQDRFYLAREIAGKKGWQVDDDICRNIARRTENVPQVREWLWRIAGTRDPKLRHLIWNEENLERYRRSCAEPADLWGNVTHMLFYVDPVGTLEQIQMTVSLTIQYLCHHELADDLLEELLRFDFPLLRVDGMSETEPRSGQFQPVCFNLLKAILERRDIPLLKKLRQYTDFSAYSDCCEQVRALLREEI